MGEMEMGLGMGGGWADAGIVGRDGGGRGDGGDVHVMDRAMAASNGLS